MVGIAHKGIAFPISWTVLPDEGSSSAEAQQEALRRLFDVVDPTEIKVVVGYRDFISAEWLSWLQAQEASFAVRLRSDRRLGLSPEGPSPSVRMFAALKSWGYSLEKTDLTEPSRVQRLIGLLALAFAWTHIVGERRAAREGPPRK